MDILKSNIAVGLGVAVAATMLAPIVLPVVASVGRPFAKSMLKAGMLFYEKSREAVAVTGEVMEDLIAEIRAEQAERHAGARRSAAAGDRPAREQATDAYAAAQGAAKPQAAPEAKAPFGNGAERADGVQEQAPTRFETRSAVS